MVQNKYIIETEKKQQLDEYANIQNQNDTFDHWDPELY